MPEGKFMKDDRKRLTILKALVMISLSLGSALSFPVHGTASPAVSTGKTLVRIPDPVVINNKVLSGIFDGLLVEQLRVLAYRKGSFQVIPFQVDERGSQGDLILTQGMLAGKERDKEGNYVAAGSWKIFNSLDEIIFLARDMGGRAPRGQWPPGAEKAVEVQALDPLNHTLGWVFIAFFPEPPPLTAGDYLSYRTKEGEKGKTEVHIQSDHYHAGFTDHARPVAQSDWNIFSSAGKGKDFMTTFRTMMQLKVGFITFNFTLKNIIPKRLGQIDGPVRVVRRIRNSIRFAGIPIPDIFIKRLAGTALDADSFYYPDYFYFTGKLNVPRFIIKYGKKSQGIFFTEFNTHAVGMSWLDEKNDDHACLVDGMMSPQELALDDRMYQWSLLYGEHGGWMNILTFGEAFQDIDIRLYYNDNAIQGPEPEADFPVAAFGSTGYLAKDFQKIKEGKPLEFTTNIFAIDSDFKRGDEIPYINLIQHPLEISVTGAWEADSVLPSD